MTVLSFMVSCYKARCPRMVLCKIKTAQLNCEIIHTYSRGEKDLNYLNASLQDNIVYDCITFIVLMTMNKVPVIELIDLLSRN